MHKHDCNEISFDWFIRLVFTKTGGKIKRIETQSDAIWENIYWKTQQ